MAQAVNNFTITGNIAQEPQLRTTANGKNYAFITVAVNGLNKDKADFISFIIWEKLAENVTKYCDKGDCISVIGYISAPVKDGKTTIQLTGDAVTFLHKASKKTESKPDPAFVPENDTFQKPGNSGDIFATF